MFDRPLSHRRYFRTAAALGMSIALAAVAYGSSLYRRVPSLEAGSQARSELFLFPSGLSYGYLDDQGGVTLASRQHVLDLLAREPVQDFSRDACSDNLEKCFWTQFSARYKAIDDRYAQLIKEPRYQELLGLRDGVPDFKRAPTADLPLEQKQSGLILPDLLRGQPPSSWDVRAKVAFADGTISFNGAGFFYENMSVRPYFDFLSRNGVGRSLLKQHVVLVERYLRGQRQYVLQLTDSDQNLRVDTVRLRHPYEPSKEYSTERKTDEYVITGPGILDNNRREIITLPSAPTTTGPLKRRRSELSSEEQKAIDLYFNLVAERLKAAKQALARN